MPSEEHQPQVGSTVTQRFVARQPVLDRDQRVFGYELLFRSGECNAFDGGSDPTAATCTTIDTSLLIGTNSLTAGKRAFVNCTRQVLLGEMVTVLPRDLSVLEILENIAPDRELLDRCRWLRKNGYMLALDDFTDRHGLALIEIADIIKVDFLATNIAQQADLATRYRRRGITMLAEKIESADQFELAKKLGYSYFQGYFFSKPVMISTPDIPLLQTTCLLVLRKTFDPDYDSKQVEKIIKQEPSLCYRLLRYLDSAAFGLYPIRSIGHALTILGQHEVQKWVALVAAVLLGERSSTELVSMALARARCCELLAGDLHRPDTDYFFAGLLSLMDAILRQPMSVVLAQLPIARECREAIEGRENELGSVLQTVIACERAQWDVFAHRCAMLKLSEPAAWDRYSQAVRWAQTFSLGQGPDNPTITR